MYLDNFKSDHTTSRYCYCRRCFVIVTLLSILIFKIATFFFYTHIFCTLKLLKFIKNYWQTISHLVTCIQSLFYSIKDKNVICPYRTMSFLEYYRKSTWDIGHELDATFFYKQLIIFIYYKVKMLIFYDKTLIWYFE